MIEYYFEVKQQHIEGPDNATFISGSAEIYSAVFHFDSIWDGYVQTAVFECENERRERLVVNGQCIVPWEILHAGKHLRIGIYGTNGNKVMPTIYSAPMFVSRGAEPSVAAQEHSPTVFDQIAAIGQLAAEASTNATAAKIAAETALNAFHSPTASAINLSAGSSATAVFDGQNFTLGIPQGAQGDTGAAGKSAYESAQDGGYTGTEVQFNTDLAAVSLKQGKMDSALTTTDKTIIGSINELNQEKANQAAVETTTPTTLADNTIYNLANVSALPLQFPSGAFDCIINLTTAASGAITITFPTSIYQPAAPTFGNGETWTIWVRNNPFGAGGIVMAQKAVNAP